jgi:prepilin-type processing-associated H-X9-DG protein
VASAVVLTLALSFLLAWIPILGPFLAGYAGGRRAARPVAALAAGLVSALVWSVLLVWVSRREFRFGDTSVFPGPIFFLAWMTASAIVGGALLGASSGGARIAGLLVIAGGLIYFVPRAAEVWKVVADVRAATMLRPEPETSGGCPNNLARLYAAAQIYADGWDGRLPPADRWLTAIRENVQKDDYLHCPAVWHQQPDVYGYSMNPALGGKRLVETPNRAVTPLFYDSTDLKVDAHVGIESVPSPGRHGGRNNVLYSDGHVEQK